MGIDDEDIHQLEACSELDRSVAHVSSRLTRRPALEVEDVVCATS